MNVAWDLGFGRNFIGQFKINVLEMDMGFRHTCRIYTFDTTGT